jgi:AraC-like DNA-binding protein
MQQPTRLHDPAAPDAVLCVGAGRTLYVGSLDQVDWHRHGAPVFIAGVHGAFRLRLPGGDWTPCRAAIIPAGVRHALDLAGDPLAVFYPEPHVAGLPALTHLGRGWKEREGILLGERPSIAAFREIHERADSIAWSGEALDDMLAFALRRSATQHLDPRLGRVVRFLEQHPDDLTGAGMVAVSHGLSVSRFLHLFSDQVGVPFRRYRIWNRVRAAVRLALGGSNFTAAAIGAGFSDSAHFTRCFRETFGVTPSYVFGRIARAGAPADRDLSRASI